MNENIKASENVDAGVVRGSGASESANATGVYVAQCFDSEGNLKWSDTFDNLVTTVGKNFALDTYLAGSGYTAAWFLGLVDGGSAPSYNAADTMSSHAGWTENVTYSNAARPTTVWSSAASGSKSLSAALAFNINGTATIAGCFLTTSSTKSGTTGTLYSAGNFSGGNKSVSSGDTLNVSYTASL